MQARDFHFPIRTLQKPTIKHQTTVPILTRPHSSYFSHASQAKSTDLIATRFASCDSSDNNLRFFSS